MELGSFSSVDTSESIYLQQLQTGVWSVGPLFFNSCPALAYQSALYVLASHSPTPGFEADLQGVLKICSLVIHSAVTRVLISSCFFFPNITFMLELKYGKDASKLKFCKSNNFDCCGSSLFKKSQGEFFCKLSHQPSILKIQVLI